MKFHAASSVIYHEEHEGHEVNGILYETLRALRVLRGENKLLLAAEACSLFSALSPVKCCGHPRIDKPPWTSFKQDLLKKCFWPTEFIEREADWCYRVECDFFL